MMRNPSKSSLVSIIILDGGGGGGGDGETNVFEPIEQYSSNHCSLFVERVCRFVAQARFQVRS